MWKSITIKTICALAITLLANKPALADTRVIEFSATVPEQAAIEPPSPSTPGFSAENPALAQLDTSNGSLTKIISDTVFFTVKNNEQASVSVAPPVAMGGTFDPTGDHKSLLTFEGTTTENAVSLSPGSNTVGVSITIDSNAPIKSGNYQYQVTVTVSIGN